ncbi:MAG: hypothetical protein ACLU48_02320 [Clostridiaceae bacterium]
MRSDPETPWIAREILRLSVTVMNDLAMIRYAGNSIIMEKQRESLEPYATFHRRTWRDDEPGHLKNFIII